jgi:hypothetical protein
MGYSCGLNFMWQRSTGAESEIYAPTQLSYEALTSKADAQQAGCQFLA